MVKQREPFNFEVKSEKFSLSVSGQPVDQAAQYFADALGLLGEPIGTVTDVMQRYRISRAEAASAGVFRAHEIAKQEGKTLASPSPKLLSPWLEGASREDLSSDNILDIWAKILASATADFDPKLRAFIDICERIGPEEAQLFEQAISYKRRLSVGVDETSHPPVLRKYIIQKMIASENRKYAKKLLDRVLAYGTRAESSLRRPIRRVFHDDLDRVSQGLHGLVTEMRMVVDKALYVVADNEIPAELLRNAGLFDQFTLNHKRGAREVELVMYEPTLLGIDFYRLLFPEKLKIARGSELHEKHKHLLEDGSGE